MHLLLIVMQVTPSCGDSAFPSKMAEVIGERLSAREQGILELIGNGLSNKEIGRALGIGSETVKSHVSRIFIKLGVEKRAQAVVVAQTCGLIEARPMSRIARSVAAQAGRRRWPTSFDPSSHGKLDRLPSAIPNAQAGR